MTEDWQPGLAATKVQPPAPPRHLVHRSRLDAALDTAVDAHVPLVLVSAPAGSGKTTLLAAWLASRSDTVVPALVNRLADLGEPLLLVIDDYHLVDDERIHRGVERLVDLCPPQVTVVLATRMDPPFRIGRLRVRNQVAEVRADDPQSFVTAFRATTTSSWSTSATSCSPASTRTTTGACWRRRSSTS